MQLINYNNSSSNVAHKTISDLVICNLPEKMRVKVEDYRVKYEKTHPKVDLSRFYTSMRSDEEQAWMLENCPVEFWEGLPEFYRSYLDRLISHKASKGALDDIPSLWMQAHYKSAGKLK